MQNLIEEAEQLRQMCYPNTQPQSSSLSTVRSDVPVPSTSGQVRHESQADVTVPCVSTATNGSVHQLFHMFP